MKQYAIYIVFFGALLSSTSGLFVENMSEDLAATSRAWIRMIVPVGLVGMYLIYKRRNVFRAQSKTMMIGSLINSVRMTFFFLTFMFTTMSKAVIVFYTWPLFATLLSIVILKEQVSRKELFILFASFAGVLVICYDQELSLANHDLLGLGAGVITAFLYSCTVIFFKQGSEEYNPVETIFYQNIVGAVAFLPFMFFNSPPTSQDWALCIGHGTVIGVVMFMMFFFGLKHMPASRTSMITYVEVIGGILLGYFVLHEEISLPMIIGACIILGGSVLLRTLKVSQ